MFCIKCGTQLGEGSRFCPKCGTPVQQSGAPLQQPGTPIRQPGVPLQQPDGEGLRIPHQDKKQGGKALPIILALLIVLLLVGVGAGVWYFAGHYQSVLQFFDGTAGNDERESADSADGKKDRAKEQEAEEEIKEAAKEREEIPLSERTPINLNIRQVDNSKFPEVTFYASVVDEADNVVEGLKKTDFTIQEITEDGKVADVTIEDVYQVLNEDTISVNLVLDASGSMLDWDKMEQAQNAAKALISRMKTDQGDRAEVISFNDYVYLNQEFTREGNLLTEAIDGILPTGGTALYDALYAGLYQTYYESGAKCVIGFTDGMENSSSYTFDDVIAMSQNTGIPVYIIGIGEEYDADALRALALQCSGEYYSANVSDLEDILTDIYLSIYEQQQDYYVFQYTAKDRTRMDRFRDIILTTSDTAAFTGTYQKEYVPQSDLSGAFGADYADWDFMLGFSGQREITEADLAGFSLAQLRIARNEIFARHGRQFRDIALNQWFYAKEWYLNLPVKYSPDDFDRISPSPLSKLELKNIETISNYEKMIMDSRDIYPHASDSLLSDYDLALSKAVLKNALQQMRSYRNTDILRENMRLVQEAIDKEDIEY